MGIVEDITTPRKNYILRMWLVAGAIAAAVFLLMLWQDRFRAECKTDEAFYGLLGIEQNGVARASFSGKNFFVKARKMGLGNAAREEVRAKIVELCESGAIELPANATPADVPVLWLYANGRSKEIRDEAFRSRGEFFFAREKICISVADGTDFSVQTNPETYSVFHAKTGEAICAIPLFERPPQTPPAKESFFVQIETRANAAENWRAIGKFPVKFSAQKNVSETPAEAENVSEISENANATETANAELAEIQKIVPALAEIRNATFPRQCRFYSSAHREHKAFGELEIALAPARDNSVPASAWFVENVKISAGGKILGYRGLDAFHTNVRFLHEEDFETREPLPQNPGALLMRVPVAKTLFPRENVSAEPWKISARLARTHPFREDDLHSFGPLKISKSPTRLEFAGSRVAVRAFTEKDYFRLLANGVPALVLEISAEPESRIFWQPFRVKTDKGEDLSAESVVVVRPGVRQYWFMPATTPSGALEIVYAITHTEEISAEIVPEIR